MATTHAAPAVARERTYEELAARELAAILLVVAASGSAAYGANLAPRDA